MVVKSEHPARIGMVNYINTAPFYEIWRQRHHSDQWQVTEAPPTTLNQMLFAGQLDLGFISSHEYGAHPHLYKILGGLSISATGPVGSVFLFSQTDPLALTGQEVLLSAQSQTSVALVKIILEEFMGLQPKYRSGPIPTNKDTRDMPKAIMAIGDDALRLQKAKIYSHCLDLSGRWYEETGLPFVFAVWGVRQQFCQTDPITVAEIHHELQSCIQEGKEQLPAICKCVAPRIPMSVKDCHDYLQKIEYDLTPSKVSGLELFFAYLIRRGEGAKEALPLDICVEDF